MKALIWKDWMMLLRQGKLFLIFPVMFAVFGAVEPENTFFLFYVVVFLSMLPVSLIGFEETSKWNLYEATLPIFRKTAVAEKYVMGFLAVLAGSLISLASRMIAGQGGSELFGLIPIMLMMGLVFPIISLPLIFKLGVAKARIWYLVVLVVAMSLVGISGKILAGSEGAGGVIDFAAFMGPELLWLGALLTIVVYLGSMLLSIRIYERKEL